MAGYFLNVTIVATLILLGFGGFLVYDSVSHTGLSQFPEVIGGALLLALGLTLLYSQAKFAVRWMHAARTERDRNS
jgi:ABC-type nickel/cobalt efflux system permease component RcnA